MNKKYYKNPKNLVTSHGLVGLHSEGLSLDDIREIYNNPENNRGIFTSWLPKVRPELYAGVVKYSEDHNLECKSVQQAFYNFCNSLTEKPVCEFCGKPAPFNHLTKKYRRFCNAKCQNNDPSVKKRHAETNIRVYGVDNAAKNDAVRKRMMDTNLERYGNVNPMKNEKVVQKARETCQQKYGVSWYSSTKEFAQRFRDSMMKKYGVPYGFQNPEIYAKRTQTCMERYGDPYPGKSKLLELATKTRLSVYDNLETIFPNYEIQCSRDEFLGVYEHENTWKCKSCGKTFSRQGAPFCECQRRWTTQIKICDFVRQYYPNAEFENSTILPFNREIDIYVPELNLGFEFNGLFWHSEANGKDRQYHLQKTLDAQKAGVRLIHIFEDEWLEKPRVVKTKIKRLLGVKTKYKIYARKCTVGTIDSSVAIPFLDKYHIQGFVESAVHVGVMFKGRLVAVASFNPKDKKTGSWYLTRYATVFNFNIVGGCGKAISHFEHKYRPSLIRTFADRRWSVGDMYYKLGFKLAEVARPVYWYYLPHNGGHRIHRFNLRKDNKNMFPIVYDKKMTERELATKNGYYRVWDCGQLVFDKQCKQQGSETIETQAGGLNGVE